MPGLPSSGHRISGFDRVKYAADESLTAAGRELVAFEARDFAAEKPASADMMRRSRRPIDTIPLTSACGSRDR